MTAIEKALLFCLQMKLKENVQEDKAASEMTSLEQNKTILKICPSLT